MGQELGILSEIAKTQPQAVYSSFITEFRQKLTYYVRTIKGASTQFRQKDEFKPPIIGGTTCNL